MVGRAVRRVVHVVVYAEDSRKGGCRFMDGHEERYCGSGQAGMVMVMKT